MPPRRSKFFFAFPYSAFSTFPAGSGVMLFDELDAGGIWANCLSREGEEGFWDVSKKRVSAFKDGARGTSGQT